MSEYLSVNGQVKYLMRHGMEFHDVSIHEAKELLRLFKNHIDSRLITYNKTGMLNDVPENYKNHLIQKNLKSWLKRIFFLFITH